MHGRGFTLIELMVVLLIAAIVLAAGVPAMQDIASEQQLVSAGNQFFHSVNLTRSQALRHGQRAEMAPTDGRDWQTGWQVRVGQRVLMRQAALPKRIAVAYTQGGEVLGYHPGGQPVTRGSWYFSSDSRSRVVVINFLGRVRICNPHRDSHCSQAASD